jgi:hypothetical protein
MDRSFKTADLQPVAQTGQLTRAARTELRKNFFTVRICDL